MPSLYTILSGSEHMDVHVIHAFLKDSYWARNIPIDLVRKSIDNSLCYGAFLGNEQVGFARLVTDYTTFGYLADVFVLEAHRGNGLAKRLVGALLDHPEVQQLRNITLVTKDAHELYRPLGFHDPPVAANILQKLRPDMYLED